MSEYDDYVSGRVDANYQEWLEKNPEHKPEHLLTEAEKQEGWDFAAEVTIASLVAHCEELQAKLAVAEAEVERLTWMLTEGQKRYADSRWWADLARRWGER